MLYLTRTMDANANKASILHYVYIEHRDNGGQVRVHAGGYTLYTCIIDIDELDACAMVLKGSVLFKVESIIEQVYITGTGPGIIHVANHTALLDWWGSLVDAM